VGPYSTPWGAGTARNVTVTGVGGVPAGADAVLLNVTVTDTTAQSFLTVWPAGQPQPLASSLNWTGGVSIPNAVTVQVGASGQVSIFNNAGSADVVVDVVGYYKSTAADGFAALAPVRVLDSRAGSQVGPYSTPWGAGTARNVTVAGVHGVPANADAVVLNVTVTDTSAPSFLTVWPAGQTQPLASSLNWVAGASIPNAVTVKVGTSGQISMFNNAGSTDVVADVVGYYVAGSGDGLIPFAPVRVLDSRPGSQIGPYATPWGGGTARNATVTGGNGALVNEDAAVLNVTVTDTSAPSFLTVWPAGQTQPLASSLNWTAGVTIPNAVTVKVGTNSQVSVFNNAGSTDVIADFVGYFTH